MRQEGHLQPVPSCRRSVHFSLMQQAKVWQFRQTQQRLSRHTKHMTERAELKGSQKTSTNWFTSRIPGGGVHAQFRLTDDADMYCTITSACFIMLHQLEKLRPLITCRTCYLGGEARGLFST